MNALDKLTVQKIEKSRISALDPENIVFGHTFSDHMFSISYSDGAWQKPVIKPYGDLTLSPATAVLHYSQTIFEGMKAYKNSAGEALLFRPEENARRFNESARRMCMPEVDPLLFVEALKLLVDIDSDWVPTAPGSSLYIRPFMIATDPYVGIRPSQNYEFMIITCPAGSYYSDPVSVKIETGFSRAVRGGTGNVKAGGNYAGALYPALLAQNDGFHQVIWTDAQEHKYIEEVSTMNIIFRIGDALITPESSDTILAGITRRSVMDIARDMGVKTEERLVSVAEIIEALESGTLLEAFGAGTAVTIAPVARISYEGKDYSLPPLNGDSLSSKILKELDGIRYGEKPDRFNWMVKCNSGIAGVKS